MAASTLASARRLFRARRFPDVIRLLEPEVFRHRESPEYFLILGISCLHAGDFGGATSYLSRARQLAPGTITALLGLAVVHLRRSDRDQALKLWLEALEEDPGNAVARRGMNLLRKGLSQEGLQDLVDGGGIRALYPPMPGTPRWMRRAIAVLAVAAVCLAGLLGWRLARPTPRPRPGVAGIALPGAGAMLIEPGQQVAPVYTMGERDVAKTFEDAKRHLLEWRDNLAIVDLNRILASNASAGVKERARALKGLTVSATFDTLQDRFTYRQVAAQPALYDGCSVAWAGKVANLQVTPEAITFDLLVGYQQDRELEGIVAVHLGFAAEIDNGIGMEVLGRVVVEGGRIRLEGISLHRLLQ
jgi:hypothetical protein